MTNKNLKLVKTYASFADATRVLLESRNYIASHVAPTIDGRYVVTTLKTNKQDNKQLEGKRNA